MQVNKFTKMRAKNELQQLSEAYQCVLSEAVNEFDGPGMQWDGIDDISAEDDYWTPEVKIDSKVFWRQEDGGLRRGIVDRLDDEHAYIEDDDGGINKVDFRALKVVTDEEYTFGPEPSEGNETGGPSPLTEPDEPDPKPSFKDFYDPDKSKLGKAFNAARKAKGAPHTGSYDLGPDREDNEYDPDEQKFRNVKPPSKPLTKDQAARIDANRAKLHASKVKSKFGGERHE